MCMRAYVHRCMCVCTSASGSVRARLYATIGLALASSRFLVVEVVLRIGFARQQPTQ